MDDLEMEALLASLDTDSGMNAGLEYDPASVPQGSGNWDPTTGTGGGTANIGGGGIDWATMFGKDGAGNAGIGSLMMLLNAMRQRKDAKRGEGDEQAAVQQGTSAMARSLSTQGNPAGSGRAQQELTNYASTALARFRAARRAEMAAANNNLYGAGGASLQAMLAALAQGGAFG